MPPLPAALTAPAGDLHVGLAGRIEQPRVLVFFEEVEQGVGVTFELELESRLRDAYPRLAPKDWHAYMSALAAPGITPDARNAGA